MKNKAKRIIKNSMIITVGRYFDFLLGFASVVMVARYLGVQKFGEYTLVRTVGILLIPLITWGTMSILIRDISIEIRKSDFLIPSALVLHVLIMAVIMVLITIIFLFIPGISSEIRECIYLVIIRQIFFVMLRSNTTVFVATERVIYRTLLDSAMRLLTVIMFGLVIVADLKMKGLFQAAALVYCSGFIMSCVLINRKGFLMEWKIDKASILYLIKESHMLMISQFIVQGYTQVNIIVLKMFSMVEQISFYQIPQRIIEPFRLLPRSLMMAYLPSLSILGNDKNNRIALVKVYTSLLKNITTCGLLICICAVMFAKTIVFLFFGKEFMGAVIPLQISIWAIIPFSINTVQMSLLTASRNQNILYVGNGCCLIVSAIMGIILIPRYGAIGASMAIIISSITLVLVNAYFLRDRIGRASIEWPAVFRLLFSSLALWTVIWSLKSYIPDLALFPIGIIVYGSILFWLKFFTTDEIDVISGMVKSLLFRTGLVHRK